MMTDASDRTTKVSGDTLAASFGCNEGRSWNHVGGEDSALKNEAIRMPIADPANFPPEI
jgi:hypothetical protein